VCTRGSNRAPACGPSTSPLAVTVKTAVRVGVVALIFVAICWYRVSGRATPSIVATVDVPRDYSNCSVSFGGSPRDVPCRDVGSYLRGTLKLGSDVGVLIRPTCNSSGESVHLMTEQVHAAGYLIDPDMGGICPDVVRGDR
jgi:hypothetical protein